MPGRQEDEWTGRDVMQWIGLRGWGKKNTYR
jgi:hypothetical protein